MRARRASPNPSRRRASDAATDTDRAGRRRGAVAAADADRAGRRRGAVAARLALLVVVAVALYGRTIGFGFSYLDDDVLILDSQPTLTEPGSLWRSFGRAYFPGSGRDHIYYRPLVTASYALDASWSQARAGGYHFTNVLLHALAAALIFLLLLRLGHLGDPALFGGLLFAVHPALTEAVAWIPGRNDSLPTIFSLAAWLLLLGRRGRTADRDRTQGPHAAAAPGPWMTVGHALAWLCALCAKETAVILPAVWTIHLVWLERRPWRSAIRPRLLAVWAGVLAVYLAARATVAAHDVGGAGGNAGGPSVLSGLSAARVIANLPLLLSSVGKLIVPVHLSVLAIPEDTWLWPGALAVGLLLVVAWRMRERRAHILFGLGCMVAFVAPGLPASNLLVLESRLYLPAVGAVLIACALVTRAPGQPRVQQAAGVAILTALAVAAFSYSADFRDRLTFARAAVLQSPHSSLAHRNLGVALQLAGDPHQARQEYEAALSQDPAEPVVHNNLAVLFMAEGRLPEAERELRLELSLNPTYAPAHHNLAQVLDTAHRPDEAAPHWEQSLHSNPQDTTARRALRLYYNERDPAKAARFR